VSEYNPFQEIERAIGEMSEQFGVTVGEIPVDVVDEGDQFLVHADLPGVDPSEVEVSLHDGHRLSIDVEHEATTETTDGRYVRRERRRDARSRTISLPSPESEPTSVSL
jgi:HSP20 family protein